MPFSTLKLLRVLALAVIASLAGAVTARAAPDREPTLNLYGSPGAFDTPSARFMSDGYLAVTGSTKQPDDRITIAFQVTPWLEGTARYSIVYDYQPEDDLFDRSLGFKLKLMDEGWLRPAMAIGVLDVGGTLIFGGEYIVASKQIGPFDTSLGLGFGRLGSKAHMTNPFVGIADRFRERPVVTDIQDTGRVAVSRLFHGEDVALFGNVVYDTPIRGLNLLLEYSGDDYAREQDLGIFSPDSPVNFGLTYRPWRNVEAGVGWLYGRELSLRLSVRGNLKDPPDLLKFDPPARNVDLRSSAELKKALEDRGAGFPEPEPAGPNLIALGDRRPQGEPSNGPDWSVYPGRIESADAPRVILAANAPRPAAGTRGFAVPEDVIRILGEIGYRPSGISFADGELVLQITQTRARPPLQCDEISKRIAFAPEPGLDRVTFIDAGAGSAGVRCTRILPRSEDTRFAGDDGLTPALETTAQADPSASEEPGAGKPKATPWWENDEAKRKVADEIAKILKEQKLTLEAVDLSRDEARIYFNNATYVSAGKALGRAARAVTHVLPPSIEIITLILTTGDVNGTRATIPRTALERVARNGGTPEEVFTATTFAPSRPGLPEDSYRPKGRYPDVDFLFSPAFRQSLFDPDDPLRFQIYWRVGGTVKLVRGLRVNGSYAIDLYNNFNTITRESDSQLPQVRSDFANFLREGESGLERLEVVYLKQILPELYGRVSAGYFESAYGGIGGELLYRPFARRWAVGLEVNQVWKRDYDRGFGFQDYNVVTGHASLYYESPFYDLNFNVHAGRYLAKDYGATFEVMRHFDNGAEVGAFATFTDVGFDKFGEGSFDKGIIIRIPLDLISLFSTQNRASITLRPLTRDGGARLSINNRLYELTRPTAYGGVTETWEDFLTRR